MNEPLLELAEIQQVVHLVDKSLNPAVDRSIAERRRILMRGLCELVNADVWMWSNVIANSEKPGDLFTTCFIDEGWSSPEQQVKTYELLSSPCFGQRYLASIYRAMAEERPVTLTSRQRSRIGNT